MAALPRRHHVLHAYRKDTLQGLAMSPAPFTTDRRRSLRGNAVPPLLAYQLGKALHEQLLGCLAGRIGREVPAIARNG
jgi:hypothetical protein